MTLSSRAIINGNAGGMGSVEAREQLAALLAAALPGCDLVFTREGSEVAEQARDAVEKGATLVIAGGGDGTISAVASALVRTPSALGVLPMGTLNHFARDLGIPLELEAAVGTLVEGRLMAVDVGSVNDRPFLNNSGLGLYPDAVELRDMQEERGWWKWTATLWGALKALSRYRRLTIRVSVEEKQITRTTPMVFVGNNEYVLDGVRVPARKGLTGGVLCLYIPHPAARLKMLWFWVRTILGRPRTGTDFDAMLVQECSIESRHRHLTVSIDGEVARLLTPLHYRIQPGVLRVKVP